MEFEKQELRISGMPLCWVRRMALDCG